MLQRLVILTACFSFLVGCAPIAEQKKDVGFEPVIVQHKSSTLEAWWSFFGDSVLDKLISSALSLNFQNNKSTLEPKDAEVSYDALRSYYRAPQSGLIADVVQNYVRFRNIQNQHIILGNYIHDREGIVAHVTDGKNKVEADDPRYVKMKSALNALYKKKQSLEKSKASLSRKITILTKLLPEYVSQILKENAAIPESDITLILASPVSAIALSPDIVAARALLAQNMNARVTFSDTGALFPDMMMNSFFGIADDVFLNNGRDWSVTIGHSIKNLQLTDLDRLYIGEASYDLFRENFLSAIMDIEHLIISYAHIEQQHIVLRDGARKAVNAYEVLKENSAQYTSSYAALIGVRDEAYKAELAALHAEFEKTKILVDIYGKLGVY